MTTNDTATPVVQQDLTALQAELAKARAENALLKAQAASRAASRISCKVSVKGALSIYGLGKFPVTLFLSQYEALNSAWPTVQAFVDAHRSEFATKDK